MSTVPASGPRNAKLAIVGMAPASQEVRTGIPFMGESGRILNESLAYLGVSRDDVFVTNILDFPIPLERSVYSVESARLQPALARLMGELESVRPNTILLCGNDPLKAICDLVGVTKWRGSIIPSTKMIPGTKCVVAMHPATFVRGQWKWLPVFKYIDMPRALEESRSRELSLPTRTAITGPSFKMTMDYIDWLESVQGPISVDIEGWGVIDCIGLGARIDEAICIPMWRAGGPYWTTPEEVIIWRRIAALLESKALIAQNASYEFINFWRYGIYPSTLWMDTMTAHHCLYPDFGGISDEWSGRKRDIDNPGHGLAFINSQYTRTPFYKDDGRKWSPEHGDHAFWRYNCLDVMVTYDAAMQMDAELRTKGLREFYIDYYIKPFWAALRMEWDGIEIDVEKRSAAGLELNERALELQTQIDKTLGYKLNINSPKQMQKLLYEEKRYQVRKNPKTGKASADKVALSYFAAKKGDALLDAILDLRKIKDTISDVINQELDAEHRIHTHYKIGGTNGSRWSSTESILGNGTNLQNVPRGGIARKLFLP
jgi:uracil-DNA glycosylase